jgi:hypothetical protein
MCGNRRLRECSRVLAKMMLVSGVVKCRSPRPRWPTLCVSTLCADRLVARFLAEEEVNYQLYNYIATVSEDADNLEAQLSIVHGDIVAGQDTHATHLHEQVTCLKMSEWAWQIWTVCEVLTLFLLYLCRTLSFVPSLLKSKI